MVVVWYRGLIGSRPLECRLVPAPVERADGVFAEVALVAQRDQAAGGRRSDVA